MNELHADSPCHRLYREHGTPKANCEDAVRDCIAWWLEEHGCDIYTEKGEPTYSDFELSGAAGRPDMLVIGRETVLVEVKSGDSAGALSDAIFQSFGYLDDLLHGAEVLVASSSIEVDGVLVGNYFSPYGVLYNEAPGNCHFGSNRPNGGMPDTEGLRTEDYVRIQWGLYRARAEEYPLGFGALLSTALNGRGHVPAALWYRDQRQFNQEFTALGFEAD